MSIERIFCWLPTNVWSGRYYRDGFVWLRFAYRGDFDRIYRTSDQASRSFK